MEKILLIIQNILDNIQDFYKIPYERKEENKNKIFILKLNRNIIVEYNDEYFDSCLIYFKGNKLNMTAVKITSLFDVIEFIINNQELLK